MKHSVEIPGGFTYSKTPSGGVCEGLDFFKIFHFCPRGVSYTLFISLPHPPKSLFPGWGFH